MSSLQTKLEIIGYRNNMIEPARNHKLGALRGNPSVFHLLSKIKSLRCFCKKRVKVKYQNLIKITRAWNFDLRFPILKRKKMTVCVKTVVSLVAKIPVSKKSLGENLRE